MFGCIMPEPLQIAPMRAVPPERENSAAVSLRNVSVVIIASAASELFFPRFLTRGSMPLMMASVLSAWPITPVEATSTELGEMPSEEAAAQAISSAASYAPGAQAFALPLLAIMALALPDLSLSISSSTGAALTELRVKTPAAVHSVSEKISARSSFSRLLPRLTPQCTPDAENPDGAVTPPSVYFNAFNPFKGPRPLAGRA